MWPRCTGWRGRDCQEKCERTWKSLGTKKHRRLCLPVGVRSASRITNDGWFGCPRMCGRNTRFVILRPPPCLPWTWNAAQFLGASRLSFAKCRTGLKLKQVSFQPKSKPWKENEEQRYFPETSFGRAALIWPLRTSFCACGGSGQNLGRSSGLHPGSAGGAACHVTNKPAESHSLISERLRIGHLTKHAVVLWPWPF